MKYTRSNWFVRYDEMHSPYGLVQCKKHYLVLVHWKALLNILTNFMTNQKSNLANPSSEWPFDKQIPDVNANYYIPVTPYQTNQIKHNRPSSVQL